MSHLPYPLKYKLPLTYLSLQEWNNFVKNLLFINQIGSVKLLNYYQNGNFQNLNNVKAQKAFFNMLEINGYEALWNNKVVNAYTFGEGEEAVFQIMSRLPSVYYNIALSLKQNYPELSINEIIRLTNYILAQQTLKKYIKIYVNKLNALVPKLSTLGPARVIAGTQVNFSGTMTLSQLISSTLNPAYLEYWKAIMIQNLGNNPIVINNSINLLPGKILRIEISNPDQITLQAQTPTLLSEEIEFSGIPISGYSITLTNSQSDPTPSPFQQLLNLNLSNILSSSSQLLNLQFCLDLQCKTPLYAWISTYTSNLSTVIIWVNLPISIPANSSITIYMFLKNSVQYPYTGINAYYNTNYDNGVYVFDAYMNAMGTQIVSTNPLQIYSNIYSSVQFTPQSGSTPGYLTAMTGQGGSYTDYYFNAPNTNRLNEIIEGIAYYSGSADQQGLQIYGNNSFCNNSAHGNAYFFCNGYTGDWDPYTGQAYIWYGTTQEVSPGYNSSYITSNGYNFYQVIATSSEIQFYSGIPSSPISDINSISTVQQASWSTSVNIGGTYVGTIDDSGGATHTGYWYWFRARAYPPNGVMPSNSQPTFFTAIVT